MRNRKLNCHCDYTSWQKSEKSVQDLLRKERKIIFGSPISFTEHFNFNSSAFHAFSKTYKLFTNSIGIDISDSSVTRKLLEKRGNVKVTLPCSTRWLGQEKLRITFGDFVTNLVSGLRRRLRVMRGKLMNTHEVDWTIFWDYTVKIGKRHSRPQPGCHLPNSPWARKIKLFPPRESVVSDIPAEDGNAANLFLRCIILTTVVYGWTKHIFYEQLYCTVRSKRQISISRTRRSSGRPWGPSWGRSGIRRTCECRPRRPAAETPGGEWGN